MTSDKSQLVEELKRTIRDVKNFPKAGIIFKDVTPVLLDAKLFAQAVQLMAEPYRDARITRVVSIDLHAGQIQGFFNIPFDHLYALPIMMEDYLKKNLKDFVREKVRSGEFPSEEAVVEAALESFRDRERPDLEKLIELGESGDIIVDGGNTNWKVALDDCARIKAKGMHYMDAGTSGGIWGQDYGYCLMVGAEQEIFDHCLPVLKDLAPDDGGLVRTGAEGSGHFVKMVHNGIEYGLMQAYAEGFQVMKMSKSFPGMDIRAIAEAWRTGSVVRSWLLDLVALGLAQDPELASIKGWVEDTGEGRWTVEAAIEESVPTPVIAESLFARFRSRMENTFGDRMLAMMRAQFGGHAVVKDASSEK